jgi:hypothetical protein
MFLNPMTLFLSSFQSKLHNETSVQKKSFVTFTNLKKHGNGVFYDILGIYNPFPVQAENLMDNA